MFAHCLLIALLSLTNLGNGFQFNTLFYTKLLHKTSNIVSFVKTFPLSTFNRKNFVFQGVNLGDQETMIDPVATQSPLTADPRSISLVLRGQGIILLFTAAVG
jgi:hypothetical protein